MKNRILISLLCLGLSACGVVDKIRSGRVPDSGPYTPVNAPPAYPPSAPVQRLPGAAGGQSAAALDTTTAAERAAALAPAPASAKAAGVVLGKVKVSLGPPAEAGFWLKGGIVAAPGKGRVTAASGQSVAVELRPGAGAAQLSLAAFRALGLALTDLPEVTVTAE